MSVESMLFDGSIETGVFSITQFDDMITWLNERKSQEIFFKLTGTIWSKDQSKANRIFSASGRVCKNIKGAFYKDAIYLMIEKASTEDPDYIVSVPRFLVIDRKTAKFQEIQIPDILVPDVIILENRFTKDLGDKFIFKRSDYRYGYELTEQFLKNYIVKIVAQGNLESVIGKKIPCLIRGIVRHVQDQDFFVEISDAINLEDSQDQTISEYLRVAWLTRISRRNIKTNHLDPSEFYIEIIPSSKMQTDLAISINHLSVSFGKKQVLNNVSFSMKSGEILGIIGESGAGKTTTLRAILGEIDYEGDIKIFNIDARKTKEIAPLYGYVPQDLALQYQTFNALENILAFASQFNLPQELVLQRGKEILNELNITSSRPVSALSGGQKRRVSIAIAMAHNPKLLFLDEPTSGLDPKTRFELWRYLDIINKTYGTSIVVISHYLDEIDFCDKAAIFLNGIGFYAFGSPEELKASLPGKGLAFEVTLESVSMKAVDLLRAIEGVDFIIQRGERIRLLSDLSSDLLAEKVISTLNENDIKIHSLEFKVQVDMVDYFTYISHERDKKLGLVLGTRGAVE